MKVTVVSPWYPSPYALYSGIFVRKAVDAVERQGASVEVEVPTIYPAPTGSIPGNVIQSMDRLAGKDPNLLFETRGNTTWVPAPVPARSGYIGRARAFADSIELKRKHLPNTGDITHTHLGIPTGWAIQRVGDTPVVITEHQSTLGDVLAEPDSREAYRDALDAADAFICVSSILRDQLVGAFGREPTDKIEVIPNVVDLEDIPFVERSTPSFSSWIYVGGLVPTKGIELLLETFADYRSRFDAGATLTLVGEGLMRPWIERFVGLNGIEEAVRFDGARPHRDLGGLLRTADVMVHLSRYETFGISCLEAIGSGLPVVSLRTGGAESTWGDLESACGLLLDPNASPGDVVAAIASLRDSPGRLDPRAGRAMVESRFSSEVVGSALMDVYRRCLQG